MLEMHILKKCKLETVMPAQDVGTLHLQIPNQEWDSVLGFNQTKTVGGLLLAFDFRVNFA